MKSVFISGSGKCGETFFFNLFKNHKNILAYDETRSMQHSFFKFSKYNNLQIDEGPLFRAIEEDIKKVNAVGKMRLESSSYLSFHLKDLIERFNSKVIILIRNPLDVAMDLKEKGWYKEKYFKEKKNKKIGYQGISKNFFDKHHNFSRISPKGKFFKKWNNLDQLLKIKWFWNESYKTIFEDLKNVPKNKYKVIKLEDVNYISYIRLCKWLKIKPSVSKFMFNLKLNLVRKKNKKNDYNDLLLFNKFKSKIEKKFYKKNLI